MSKHCVSEFCSAYNHEWCHQLGVPVEYADECLLDHDNTRTKSEYIKARMGERDDRPEGWVCPVCGRGLSPTTTVCPCKDELPSMPQCDEPGKVWTGDGLPPVVATFTGDPPPVVNVCNCDDKSNCNYVPDRPGGDE